MAIKAKNSKENMKETQQILHKPTIHPDGKSAKELTDTFCAAFKAIANASEKVARTKPDKKEYISQGETAFEQAIKQHEFRTESLQKIAQEILEIAKHTSNFIC